LNAIRIFNSVRLRFLIPERLRFLNPERSDLPDYDLDFPANKREEVIKIFEDN